MASTSRMMFWSWGATTWAPSFQYTLKPLYSLGLCEAVTTQPLWQPSSRMANESSGVGRRASNRNTVMPLAEKISAAMRANSGLLLRESCATATRISWPGNDCSR